MPEEKVSQYAEAMGRALDEAMGGDRLHPLPAANAGPRQPGDEPLEIVIAGCKDKVHRRCMFCGEYRPEQQPTNYSSICTSPDNPFLPDTVGNKHHGYQRWPNKNSVSELRASDSWRMFGCEPAAPPVPQEATSDTKWNDELPRDNRFHDPLSPATAPDWAMRVAEELHSEIVDAVVQDRPIPGIKQIANLIREAGSREIAKLRADYDREHKWLNDAAGEAHSDLDSVASAIWKSRQAGSERERLARAEGRLQEFLAVKHHRPLDPCYWDMHEERALRAEVAEASRLLGGESK